MIAKLFQQEFDIFLNDFRWTKFSEQMIIKKQPKYFNQFGIEKKIDFNHMHTDFTEKLLRKSFYHDLLLKKKNSPEKYAEIEELMYKI